MKTISLGRLFTNAELVKASTIWNLDREHFHTRVRDEIVTPAMPRIAAATKQENDADYIAYALEHAFGHGV